MPWPGAPTSAQSPPINPPSQRYPATLTENSTMRDVADAMHMAFDGLTVHEQAFANIPTQIKTQAVTAATTAVEQIIGETTTGVTSFNTLTGAVLFFPGLGTVNSQLGQVSYAVEQADAGAKIVVGDSTAVTIFLDSGIAAPWFAVIDNDSSSVASLVAQTGVLHGAQSIYPGGFGIVYFDGAAWWCGSSGGASGTVPLAKLTVGGTNGSLTVSGGLISSVTNPT